MNKNTSIILGNHFDSFVQSTIAQGRYNNVSEVIRAALRLLEEEEHRVMALKKAIHDGLATPRVENFDFDEHLASLQKESITL